MTFNLTWDNFDKAFWLCPHNIKQLMKFGVNISVDFNSLEGRVQAQDSVIQSAAQQAHDSELLANGAFQKADSNERQIQYILDCNMINRPGYAGSILQQTITDLIQRVTALENK